MDDQTQPVSVGDTHRLPAALPPPYGKPPAWAILFGILLVTLGILGRSRPVPSLPIDSGGPNAATSGTPNKAPVPIPAHCWKDVFRGVFYGISKNRILLIAAGVAFYAILALFPGIAAFVSIYGLFADPSRIAAHLDMVANIAPGGAVDVVREQLTRLSHQGAAALGFGFAFSLAFSLWTANAGMSALFEALTAVYEENEKRSIIKYYSLTLAFTAGAIVLLLLLLVALVVLPLVLAHPAHPGTTGVLLQVARWPVLLALVALALAVIYRYGPSRTAPRWRWITWGSGLAACTWLAASALFSWYVANFGSYNKTYGSLGAIVGFMTWMWASMVVVLVGAKLDAELERRATSKEPAGRVR
jgi:membrane protein